MNPLPFTTAGQLLLAQKLALAWPAEKWCEVTTLVAVSGGADSVALLKALVAVQQPGAGRLAVVHVNHHLRGAESDADEQFVAQLCQSLALECLIYHADPVDLSTHGDGIEAAARGARYAFFQAAAEKVGARYIVTAHTADDQAETVLHRILRGTGLRGLGGISPVRRLSELATLIRPLLGVTRAEVLEFLQFLGQRYAEDSSNLDQNFTRNRLRHELLPHLAANYNPRVREALIRLAQQATEGSDFLASTAQKLAEELVPQRQPNFLKIPLATLPGLPTVLVREMLVRLWHLQGWPEQGMTFEKWSHLAAVAQSNDSSSLNLPGNITAVKKDGWLSLTRL